MNQKNILITGGAGFIGTHLAGSLLQEGHSVTIFDLQKSSLSHPNLKMIMGDIRNTEQLKAVIQTDVDLIFHFAAIVSVPECEQHPDESFQTNLQGTQNILNQLKELKQQKTIPIFFASSAAVYGDLCKPGHRLSENEALPRPLSFYGLHKYASEQMIRLYCENHGLKGLSFRFFNVYGPGQKSDSPYSGVITIFNKAINEGSEVKLFNYGRNVRDFIHVSEIINACMKAMVIPHEQMNGASLNLCTGVGMTIQSLYEKMSGGKTTNTVATLLPARSGDIEYSCGDPSFANSKIGFLADPKLNLNW